jgi:hypothetical protein
MSGLNESLHGSAPDTRWTSPRLTGSSGTPARPLTAWQG